MVAPLIGNWQAPSIHTRVGARLLKNVRLWAGRRPPTEWRGLAALRGSRRGPFRAWGRRPGDLACANRAFWGLSSTAADTLGGNRIGSALACGGASVVRGCQS